MKKKWKIQVLVRMEKEWNPCNCWWACKVVQQLWKFNQPQKVKQMHSLCCILEITKCQLLCDPRISLLNMTKRTENRYSKNCTYMFTTALFTISKDETIQISIKRWMNEQVWYTHVIEFYSSINEYGWIAMPIEYEWTHNIKRPKLWPNYQNRRGS